LGMDPRHGRHAFRAPSGTGDALAVFVGKRLRDCVFYLYLEVRDEGGSAS